MPDHAPFMLPDLQDPAVLVTGASTGVGDDLFLASPALSGYITGQISEVNGGLLMP